MTDAKPGRSPENMYCRAHPNEIGQDHGDGPYCRLTGVPRETCPHCTTAGRPKILVDEAMVERLRDAFALDATRAEACSYAGITLPTLTAYCNEHPAFVEEIAALKQRPVLKARETVVKDLATDSGLALKYLERKRPREFQPTATVKHEGEVIHRLDPAATEKIQKLSQLLNEQLRSGYAAPQLSGAGRPVIDVDQSVDGAPRDPDGDG